MSGKFMRVLTAPVLIILLSACGAGGGSSIPRAGTVPSGSAAKVGSSLMGSSTANGSLFHPNSEKYSDTGSKPATGRSGSAQIASRALLAKDGSALVEATTGVLDGATGAGSITKVQTKLDSQGGSEDQAQNYNHLTSGGYWNHTYAGMARNDTVQVLSHVDGVDGARTDVVTTLDTVKLRPDLAAQSLKGPARAYVHAPVNFTAIVAELNGDVGARADCVLSADGQQVDKTLGIWVDAGSSVSCAFRTTFATTGIKHLTVSVNNVVPGDWDLSNNTAETSIEIVEPLVQLGYSAYAYSHNYHYDYIQNWSDAYNGAYNSYTDSYHAADSSAYIEAYTHAQTFAFPIAQLNFTVSADGSPIVQESQANFSANSGNCATTYATGTSSQVCASPGYSFAAIQKYGGAVTYYTAESGAYCGGCQPYSYIYNNYSYSNGVTPFDLGSQDQFTLKLVDASGITYTAKSPVLQVQQYGYGPYTYDDCYNYWYYSYGNYCYHDSYGYSEKHVSASGPEGTF